MSAVARTFKILYSVCRMTRDVKVGKVYYSCIMGNAQLLKKVLHIQLTSWVSHRTRKDRLRDTQLSLNVSPLYEIILDDIFLLLQKITQQMECYYYCVALHLQMWFDCPDFNSNVLTVALCIPWCFPLLRATSNFLTATPITKWFQMIIKPASIYWDTVNDSNAKMRKTAQLCSMYSC